MGQLATQIHKGLWQGGRPPPGDLLRQNNFRLLILCAEEWQQPKAGEFPGVEVISAPNDDDFNRLPTREELSIAIKAARQAIPILEGGGKVLSTCFMGKNRSGLVSALILHLWLGVSGERAVRMIQQQRQGALRNPGFLSVLQRLASRG